MADILLFIRDGWNNLWKQKIIWLFSALSLLFDVFRFIDVENYPVLLRLFLTLIFLFLSWNSLIAVPYLAYSIATDKTVDITDTLYAVSKFTARVIGCSCLGFLIFAPCFFIIAGFPIYASNQPLQISDKLIFVSLPLSIFAAMPDFIMFGFFANDWGIWQSLKNAWTLFTDHFSVLATLGIVTLIILRIYSIMCGVLTLLIQSNFDIASLSKLNFINPFSPLSNNLLFVLLSGVSQVIFIPFSYSVFVFAYLKYSQPKKH